MPPKSSQRETCLANTRFDPLPERHEAHAVALEAASRGRLKLGESAYRVKEQILSH